MAKATKILLEDCGRDRYLMLSHLYQIWRTPRFRTAVMEGEPEDSEEARGFSLKPGIEEIPFCLLVAQLPMRALYIDAPGLMVRATMAAARLEAVCLNEEAQIAAQSIQDNIGMLRRARTHVKPDFVEENVSLRKNLTDPLCQLFERARQMPFFQGKLYVVLNGETRYTLCGQALPAGSKGSFYGFDRERRAFAAYDSYSDRLVGYGPVRELMTL